MTRKNIGSREARESLILRGIDTSKPGYRTSGFLIGEVAGTMGLFTTQDDYDHWVMTQGILRALDHLTDDDGCTDVTDELAIIAQGDSLPPYVTSAEAEVFARLIQNVYSTQRADSQLTILRSWPKLQEPKSSAEDVNEYIVHIIEEAIAYTELMKVVITEDCRTEIAARINEWIADYLLIGYMLDYARDLPKDSREGLTSVEPTLQNALKILASGLRGVRAAKEVPLCSMPKIFRLIGRYGLAA